MTSFGRFNGGSGINGGSGAVDDGVSLDTDTDDQHIHIYTYLSSSHI